MVQSWLRKVLDRDFLMGVVRNSLERKTSKKETHMEVVLNLNKSVNPTGFFDTSKTLRPIHSPTDVLLECSPISRICLTSFQV